MENYIIHKDKIIIDKNNTDKFKVEKFLPEIKDIYLTRIYYKDRFKVILDYIKYVCISYNITSVSNKIIELSELIEEVFNASSEKRHFSVYFIIDNNKSVTFKINTYVNHIEFDKGYKTKTTEGISVVL